MKRASSSACFAIVLTAAALCSAAHGQRVAEWDVAAETAVVYNPAYPGSAELAAYYAAQRHIPKERVIGLRCSQEDAVSRAEFDAELRKPLLQLFQSKGWSISAPLTQVKPMTGTALSPNVRVLVLMRGVPFQIRRNVQGSKPAEEDESSVDSEMCVLGLKNPPTRGGVRNPYYDQPARFPHSQRSTGLLIVGRLDGPDDETVRRMIDDAVAVEETGLLGRAVIDLAQKSGVYQEGEDWLKRSAETFKRAGIPVFIDRAEGLVGDFWPLPDTVLYFGWYTDHIMGALAAPDFRFKRGAIACHLHSFSASIIRSHDKAWAGPLLSKGAAVTFGNVFEPYLSLTIHFDILNKRLLEGFTVGEAAWNATPALSWMNVVLGDPLYRPFAHGIGAKLGEGPERDYALYQGTVQRMAADTDAQIKSAITQMAEKRESPRLLELTALLSALQLKHSEAADLLEHAETATENAADLLRLRLYRAEMLRRGGQSDAARLLLREISADPRFQTLPERGAASALLQALGG